MSTPFERKPAAAQPRPDSKTRSNVKPRGSRVRTSGPPEGRFQQAQVPQDAQKNYERYLALARAEALTGDRIAAENYFQHADHYFRSMHQNTH
jgi:uncharacterized MAPEG superfamily protein